MRKLLLSAFVLISASLSAQTSFKNGLFTYTMTGPNTVEVSDADSKDASDTPVYDYVIPETVENEGVTYTVTAIGEDVFYWSDVKSVSIPESVDSIKGSAFNAAKDLTEITLPSHLKYIGDYAFSSSGLKSITIPASVEEIGSSAFFTCTSLASIELGSGLKSLGYSAFYKCAFTSIELPAGIETIPSGLFYGCSKLETVKIDGKVNYVGDRAFRECSSLKSIDLPSTVTYIGEDAFLECTSLTTLKLPASLEEVGVNFAANSGITSFTVEDGNKNFTVDGGVVYSADKLVLYAAPTKGLYELTVPSGCIGIYGGAFSGSEIKSVTLPEGFLAVDNYAFCESALENINLPSSIVMIGEQAFAATQLTEVTLPAHTETLYSAAFAACEKLATVTIPSGLKFMYNRAFYGCTALKTVNCLGSKAPELEEIYDAYESQFYGVEGATLYVPKGCTASYDDAGYDDYFDIVETANGVLTAVSTTPATDSTVEPGLMSMSFDVEFDEPVTVVESSPAVNLYDGALVGGTEIKPDDAWYTNVGGANDNKLTVWGADYDGFTCSFKVENDKEYTVVIPAGVVKNAAGDLNEQIIISFKCVEPTAIDGVDADSNATVTARYNINGQKMGVAVKGINIVKMSDGKVRKVLVK